LHQVQSRPKACQVPHLLKQNQSLKTLPHLYNGGGPQCEELGLKPDWGTIKILEITWTGTGKSMVWKWKWTRGFLSKLETDKTSFYLDFA